MEISAKLKNYKQSARKVRMVLDLIRGLDTQDALAQLEFLNKRSAVPLIKLLRSAMANAEHNYSLDKNSLYIKKIYAEESKTLKRWKPRAFGRAAPIRKRYCHISLILEEKLSNLSIDSQKSGASVSTVSEEAKGFLLKSDQSAEDRQKDVKPTEKAEEPKTVKDLKEVKSKLAEQQEYTRKDQNFRQEYKKSKIIDISQDEEHYYREERQDKKKAFGKFKGFVKRVFTRKTG